MAGINPNISVKMIRMMNLKKKERKAGWQWLTLRVLATWEAGIERSVVRGQPRQGVRKTPSQSIGGQGGMHLSPQQQQEV
jgi:hypothetical protein